MSKGSLKLGGAVLWVAVYFCMMVFYTAFDITVWRTVFPAFSEWVNVMFIIVCVGGFVMLLKRTGYEIRLFANVTFIGVLIEEVLMRGFVMGGLKSTYGAGTALLVSALLFALLHFNMVQTLSAFVCGVVLGIVYLKTDAIFCCILAHGGYNLISYIGMVYPLAAG